MSDSHKHTGEDNLRGLSGWLKNSSALMASDATYFFMIFPLAPAFLLIVSLYTMICYLFFSNFIISNRLPGCRKSID